MLNTSAYPPVKKYQQFCKALRSKDFIYLHCPAVQNEELCYTGEYSFSFARTLLMKKKKFFYNF
jgi:hypothetical protein